MGGYIICIRTSVDRSRIMTNSRQITMLIVNVNPQVLKRCGRSFGSKLSVAGAHDLFAPSTYAATISATYTRASSANPGDLP